MPIFRILPAFTNVKLFLCALFVRCEVDLMFGALTDDIWREQCRTESKIEKLTCPVINSVVKSPIEFFRSTEFDSPTPSIKANAIMMGIRYLMKFFTLIQRVLICVYKKTPPHNDFVCKDSIFF